MKRKLINWSRFGFLAELKGDIENWKFEDPDEEKLAENLTKNLQKYIEYMLKDMF